MKIVLIRILGITVMYLLAYYAALFFGAIYGYLFPLALGGGSLISVAATQWIRGISLAIIFLVVFGLNFMGGENKWWWIGFAIAPAAFVELSLDPLHIYVPILLGGVAWGLGVLANKALRKLAPGVMARLT